jgi:ABC-type transport system involved in cytochrome bd biosynthesis fused ATPase/permease subunit
MHLPSTMINYHFSMQIGVRKNLESVIETGGKNLCIGERQQISLIRALLRTKSCPLFAMDEATANIDIT